MPATKNLFDELNDAFRELQQKYCAERYWYLRRLNILANALNVTEFQQWLPVLQDAKRGDSGFRDLISFLLVMREARRNNDLIDENERDKYNNWNEYFRDKVLATFPLERSYGRMYDAARAWNILDSLFPIHTVNRSPIAEILNYCGYIYLKLLDDNVDFEALSRHSNMPVGELEDAKEKIEQIKSNPLGTNAEDIAERLHISAGIAQKICAALTADNNYNPPRIIRRDGQLKYLLPKEVNFGLNAAEEILFRFTGRQGTVTRIRYKKKKEGIWRHYEVFDTICLKNCSEICIVSKRNGVSETKNEELKAIYVFEGAAENPKAVLRSDTQYTVLRSGACPENANIIVEVADGKKEKFQGQYLSAGSRLLLVANEEMLQTYDVNSGNEIGLFAFQDEPVSYVSRRDIPCFYNFPDLEIDIDDAEIYVNGMEIQKVDLRALYGDVLVEVKYQNSLRRKRCRILPADFEVLIEIEERREKFNWKQENPLEFSQKAKFIFKSEHLKDKEVEFLLPEMETGVNIELAWDNGDRLPVKFEVRRCPGAFISLKTNNIPLVADRNLREFDWDEFKEFGELHISREPDQKFAVFLYNGKYLLGGATYQTLKLSYVDLCDIVNYNEAELLNVTTVKVYFIQGNQRKEFAINSYASSLGRVRVGHGKNRDDLCLIFPCAQNLRSSNMFLVLKKVEAQADENIVIIPDSADLGSIQEDLPSSCRISEQRCTLKYGKYDERPAAQMILPGFYKQGQKDFPAKAFLGFILKPGKNSGFVRCNPGVFIPTKWSPENEETYFNSLMCSREFLNNRNTENIEKLERRFKEDDKVVHGFIDEFLNFGKFSQAQAFMDVCFHSAERTDKGWKYLPSGYIFLAEKYWLEKLNRKEDVEELLLYWDPELCSIEAMETIDFNDISEDYQDSWPSLYIANCRKKNLKYKEVTKEEVEEEIERVTRYPINPNDILSMRDLEKWIECLFSWRNNRILRRITLYGGKQEEFYNLRKQLQNLRRQYPICYRYVAEQAYKKYRETFPWNIQ